MRGFALGLGLLALLALPASAVHAQSPRLRGALADAWLQQALTESDRLDTFGRYLAAPSDVLLGGFFLSTPAWGEAPPATTAAFMASGALMLSAGIGIWANPDPHQAALWHARTSSLGFVGLGAGLLLACADSHSPCDGQPVSRHMTLAIGAIDGGLFLSWFVLSMVNAPPSPYALAISLRGTPPERRYDRVLDFLRRRERARRIGAYVSLPFGLALGTAWIGIAHEAATSTGRTVLYSVGTAMLAFSIGAFVYELVYTTPSEQLVRGQFPID